MHCNELFWISASLIMLRFKYNKVDYYIKIKIAYFNISFKKFNIFIIIYI